MLLLFIANFSSLEIMRQYAFYDDFLYLVVLAIDMINAATRHDCTTVSDHGHGNMLKQHGWSNYLMSLGSNLYRSLEFF